MNKLRIGILAFGSNVRGVDEQEMAHSNAAILEANMLRIIYTKYTSLNIPVEFYILKPANKKCKENIEEKTKNVVDDYYRSFNFVTSEDEYPNDLDLLYIQMGTYNLRMTTNFLNVATTHALSFYYILSKYPNTPILYIQTDFAVPMYIPEQYGTYVFASRWKSMDLFKTRDVNVLSCGNPETEAGKNIINLHAYTYMADDFIKVHYTNPDIQSIINIEKVANTVAKDLEYVEVPLGVAFAGKNRNFGSRYDYIKEMFFDSDIPLELMGNWHKSAEFVEYTELHSNINLSWKYLPYKDVIETYNKMGFTFYVTCEEYQAMRTVTSRFYDSLIAKAIPLIYYKDKEAVKSLFGDAIDDLVVASPDDIKEVMKLYSDKSKRMEKILLLKDIWWKNYVKVIKEFEDLVDSIIKSKDTIYHSPDVILNSIRESYVTKAISAKRKRLTIEEANNNFQDDVAIWNMNYLDHIKKYPWDFKVAVGLTSDYPDRETLDDVPKEVLNNILKLFN